MPPVEEWRAIPGPLKEGYLVSTHGRIIGLRGRVLRQQLCRKGYLTVILRSQKDERISLKAHRLVAMAFVPNPDELPEVNHLNGIKTDNRAENLEWATSRQNSQHRRDVLRVGVSKLTPEQAELIAVDSRLQKEIAADYGIDQAQVSRIKTGKAWNHD